MKTPSTFSEKQELRTIILDHFLLANNMESILTHPEIQDRFTPHHVKKVVYALENSAMLFGSGKTNARLYQTTDDGRELLGYGNSYE